MKPSAKLRQWEISRQAQDYEANRINFLRTSPLPVNDPRLFEKIRVRIIKPFYTGGLLQTPEMGIVLIARFDALDLLVRGKVEILK